MRAKDFCEKYGVSVSDTAWITRKYAEKDLGVIEWYDLVSNDLAQQPTAISNILKLKQSKLEALAEEEAKNTATSRNKKTEKQTGTKEG